MGGVERVKGVPIVLGVLIWGVHSFQAMAGDDPELTQWFRADSSKENKAPPTVPVAKQQGQSSIVNDENSQDSLTDEMPCEG